MTISNESLRAQHDGDGTSTGFTFSMPVSAVSSIQVISRVDSTGVETVETEGVTINTTLSGTPAGASGGTVTYVTPPPTGTTVTILLDPDLTQETSLPLSGEFPSPAVEAALDKATQIAKRNRDLISRTLSLDDGDVDGSGTYDANGNKITGIGNASASTDAINKSTMDAAITAAQLTLNTGVIVGSGSDYLFETLAYDNGETGAVNRRLNDRMAEILSVKDFGAVGDGTTDDWTAVSQAITAARARGVVVYFPPGQYFIDSDAHGRIDAYNCALVGANVGDGSNAGGPTTGSWIYIKGTTANSAFGMHSNLTVQGLGFYYTNQPDSATPVAHLPTFQGLQGMGAMNFVRFQDCTFLNSYIAIDFNIQTGSVGFVWIDKCSIYGIHRAIRTNGNDAVCKITNCSISFVAMIDATESGLRQYTRASGTGIEFTAGSDGIFIEHCQFLGYNKCIAYETGQAGAQHIVNCEFGQTLHAIYWGGSGGYIVNSLIANCVFFCFNTEEPTDIGYAIHGDTPSAADSCLITGCLFNQTSGSHIKLENSSSGEARFIISNNRFQNMAHQQTSGTYAAVELDHSDSIVTFSDNHAIGVATYGWGLRVSACNVLIVRGNHFQRCEEVIELTSAGYLVLSENMSFGTNGSASDDISGITQLHLQRGNYWDKPTAYSIASAATIDPPAGVRVEVTGTATIDTITAKEAGTRVMLKFASTATLEDQTIGTGNLFIAGGANFNASANDMLEFESDGTSWLEVSRSVN